MCQAISTAVAAAMYAHTQPTLTPPGGAAVVGAIWVVKVDLLRRLYSPETVTAVVKQVTMCGTVLSGTHTGNHILLVLMILLPRHITRRELHCMLLCTIDMCSSSGIIITPQVMALGRIPRLVLLVLVFMPPLLWLLLEEGRIRIITSSHSLADS